MKPPTHIPVAPKWTPRWPRPATPAGSRASIAVRHGAQLQRPPKRTRELLVAGTFSAAVFSGLLFGLNRRSAPVRHGQDPDDRTVQIEMPPLAQELPDTARVEDPPPEDEIPPAAFAPPSLVDIPSVAPDATFVESVTPPPPPGIEPVKGILTIPLTGRTGLERSLGTIFSLSQLDTVPSVRIQQQPVYPPAMLRAGVAGEVRVAFIVDANGDVRDAYAVSSTRQDFVAPAVQAVSRWKFRPGKRNGRFVNTRMTVPVAFELSD